MTDQETPMTVEELEALVVRVDDWSDEVGSSVHSDFAREIEAKDLLYELVSLVWPPSDLRAAVAAANQRADALVAGGNALAEELNKWGWGDFHYGPTDQERSVTDAIARWRALVADPPAPGLCENCGKPIAAHDALARCYPALVADQPDPDHRRHQ